MSQPAQDLPASGPAREALRRKGQFWTPPWVARAMTEYVLGGGASGVFDPAVGAGAFLLAARETGARLGRTVACRGTELHPAAREEARANGVAAEDLAGVEIRDFLLTPTSGASEAVVANPPYIRHHRLSPETKGILRAIATEALGSPIDGRAGLHVYFLIRSLRMLAPGGRLAFIVPADTCEGAFAPALWRWISSRYAIDAVVTFAPEASPFPGVDTNPLILMIRNAEPAPRLQWAVCRDGGGDDLRRWVAGGLGATAAPMSIEVHERDVREAVATGLSRPPTLQATDGPVLGRYARVMRGIATGANDFFHLTSDQASQFGIPDEFLRVAVGRTRDVPGGVLTPDMIRALDESGRPTRLLCLDGRPAKEYPPAVEQYLRNGENEGLPWRALIAQRRPWYRMERREPPPFLFAYLGRRSARFIRNMAGALPLTGFLCVYPRRGVDQDDLWEVLQDPATLAGLPLVGKSYGGGAVKVEPRALERLPLAREPATSSDPESLFRDSLQPDLPLSGD